MEIIVVSFLETGYNKGAVLCSNIQIGAVTRGYEIGQSSNVWWLLKRHEHYASEGTKA